MSVSPSIAEQVDNTGDGNNAVLISVIVTCYNQAHFLSEAIESVLAQTYKEYEIIVVDDGSADNPEEIAARFPQASFIRQENQGVAAARNKGWHESKGRFVVFLDADDRLLPHALRTGLDCFEDHSDCAFVFGRGILVDAAGKPLPIAVQAPFMGGGYERLLEANPIAFPAIVMYRRGALESVDGFHSFLKGNFIGNTSDYDLYLRLASRYPVHGHNEIIAEWRQHETNTSSKSLIMLTGCVAVLNAQRERVKGNRQCQLALKKGLKLVGSHYGEQLIQDLRVQARAGELNWAKFLASIIALLRHYPQGVIGNAFRKARVAILGGLRE